jgi:hypothetical protein
MVCVSGRRVAALRVAVRSAGGASLGYLYDSRITRGKHATFAVHAREGASKK